MLEEVPFVLSIQPNENIYVFFTDGGGKSRKRVEMTVKYTLNRLQTVKSQFTINLICEILWWKCVGAVKNTLAMSSNRGGVGGSVQFDALADDGVETKRDVQIRKKVEFNMVTTRV